MESPQKVKNRTTLRSGNLATAYLPKNRKILIKMDARTPVFTLELLTIAKISKQRMCPSIDEWIRKM